MKNYEAIIIGFGKGGKTLAADFAARGKQVALIEMSDKMYGGTCINVACIPTKSLVNSAKISTYLKPKTFEEKAKIYAKAIEEKNRVTSTLRQKNYDKLNNLENVDIILGKASFTSANEIEVKTKDETLKIKGEKIFINTGARPIVPNIDGIKENKMVFFSETLLDNDKLPKELVIIGGGYIGLEFCSMFNKFGSKVTVLQDGERFIPKEDSDMVNDIINSLSEDGVNFVIDATTKSIRNNETESIVTYIKDGKPKEIKADAVLIATGRKPNTEGLNLEKAGIEITERGAVKVDEYLKTTAKNVWAMGDVVGGLQFTYISLDDYRIVRSQLFEGMNPYTTKDRTNVPYSVFIDPSFSRVGMNEQEAKAKEIEIKIAKLPVSAIPKSQLMQEPKGTLKAIVNAKTNEILGATLFCIESYEVINIIKLAIDNKIPYTALRDQIFTHPTMSECLNDLFNTIK